MKDRYLFDADNDDEGCLYLWENMSALADCIDMPDGIIECGVMQQVGHVYLIQDEDGCPVTYPTREQAEAGVERARRRLEE